MFERKDFEVFDDRTLIGRLGRIRSELDPKFEKAGSLLAAQCVQAGLPQQTVHIAKHARRHKNPPVDTWLALSANPRGYKMVPHIELGFWDDRLFLWVALLQESKPQTPNWARVTQAVMALPAGFELSGDHTKKAAIPVTEAALAAQTKRFETVKSGEWLVGKTYLQTDPVWDDPAAFWQLLQAQVAALLPIYALLSM
ncbi:DUF1054 family protein [Lacticaseibacillus baoqingensis]|uniref:DUF1054 family protein n=1 Tax=Lacticaseibacillus baoqingensis TaxID=2486013 RepID=A0ABW4E6W3_9LACO|nr:DUF1054 family protein [Lacticaseibacillus baoqingensis]